MTDPIEAAKLAILAWMESDEAMALSNMIISDEEFDKALADGQARAAISAYRDALWQPIETAPKMRKVVVTYQNALGKRRTVMACYYVEHALEMNDGYQDVGVWVEAIGQSFAPAGWYEEIDHEGDIHALGGDPDYWQPLPEPPKEAL